MKIFIALAFLMMPFAVNAASELNRVLTVLREDIGIENVTADMNLMAGGFNVSNLPAPLTRYYNERFGRNLSQRLVSSGFGYCTNTEGPNANRQPWQLPVNSYKVTARCLARWISSHAGYH